MLIILNKYVAEAIMMDQTFAGSSNKTDTFTTEAKNGQYFVIYKWVFRCINIALLWLSFFWIFIISNQKIHGVNNLLCRYSKINLTVLAFWAALGLEYWISAWNVPKNHKAIDL